ncbi:MAG: LON peptidase substrate-binding domain-containing protein [Anaerolineales bacterium]|nr:LON peptidase substrate-binding domain-containing protein [Anaerolineales bacterium]
MSSLLPLFPLNVVLFPGMALPLHIFEPRYQAMISACIAASGPFGVVLIKAGLEVGGPAEPHAIGTAAQITKVKRLPDGRRNIEVVGSERFRILALQPDEAYLTGTVEPYPLAGAEAAHARRAAQELAPWLLRYLDLLGEAASTKFEPSVLPDHPERLAYLAASVAQVPLTEKQELLASAEAGELLQRERVMLRREVSLLRAMLANPRAHDTTPFTPN